MTALSACLNKALTTERRHLDYSLPLVVPPPNDQPVVDRVFPNGEARARRSPGFDDLELRPWVGTDPVEQVKDQRVYGCGHGSLLSSRSEPGSIGKQRLDRGKSPLYSSLRTVYE